MSEFAPPVFIGNAAGDDQAVLTPDKIEAVLADFRAWLHESAAAASAAPEVDSALDEPLDLHTLLGQMTALRHDVNLQTRATRAQQEHNAEALTQLSQALETLRQARAAAQQADEQTREEQFRPLLKSLVDTYDALLLAKRESQRVGESVLSLLAQAAVPVQRTSATPVQPDLSSLDRIAIPRWVRLAGLGGVVRKSLASLQAQIEAITNQDAAARQQQLAELQQRQVAVCEAIGRARELLDSILTGFSMSLQRVERALHQHGLEPIPCVGEPFDPERMEVVEVVKTSEKPSGEVIEEVRAGYSWRGRVFRCAQVRVARS